MLPPRRAGCPLTALLLAVSTGPLSAATPVFTNVFTADPAALVHQGMVHLYTGHDVPPDKVEGYRMPLRSQPWSTKTASASTASSGCAPSPHIYTLPVHQTEAKPET